jgi:hypothetical protein
MTCSTLASFVRTASRDKNVAAAQHIAAFLQFVAKLSARVAKFSKINVIKISNH